MRRINLRKLTILGALLCFALVLTAAPAQAALILRLTSGADSVTVTDGDPNDACPLLGCVTYIGDVGVFTVNASTGLSDPLLGGDSFAQMDLNSVNLSTSTGTLLIEFTDTDFAATGAGTLIGDVGGTVGTGGSAEFWAYKCEENVEFCTSDISVHLGPFGPGPFSGSDSTSHGSLDPYSMTLVAELTHGPGTVVSSFDFDVRNIPEPATTALFGLGLGAMAWVGRRRRSTR
jgi:hypothetical protein